MYPQIFGKYVLERELSRGGMARVLLATLRGAGGFEKKLVVKQIRDELSSDEEFVRRFVEEAKTTVALSHPNIVPVYELGVEQGTYFLALELVEGVSVTELLRDSGGRRLSPEEGAYVGVEVCRALDYAHRRMQVVHRDITPRNVMIDEEGQVKVIDFGIAAPARVAGHEVFGSPGHMPPEQSEGKELGSATDVFSVAVLLMESWSGSAPFRRATPAECDEAMRGPHPRPSDIDPRLVPLDDVIARAMALDPAARPQQADELGRVLRKFLQEIDVADVARDLGARVRSARRALAKKREKKARVAGDDWKPSAPSFVDIGPKTFAAREEVVEWVASASGPAPPMTVREEPGTRALPKSVHPPAGGDHDPPDTVATRPLEASIETGGHKNPATSPRRIAAIAIATLALGAGVLAAIRARPDDGPRSQTTALTATVSVAPPLPTPSVASLPSPSARASAPAPPVPIPATTAAAAPSAAAPSTKAHVALYGDPGTQVAVDGIARGACPVRDLALEPGAHDVLFTFEPTGERRGNRISVAPGERVKLLSDFTGVIPTIRVER